jgi:serine/threonine protein kinase
MTDERHTYAPGALLPGTPYKVERFLGAGGMGVVYVVRHTFLNRLEALKTIHPELVDRRDIAARMQQEAEVVGNLRHPNIVQVTGGGIIGDRWRLPYFAMEMLRGKNLRQVLEKKTPADTFGVATDILAALAEAHAHGVVHRDVKPENVFLHVDTTRSGGPKITPKLLDFGVVALLGGRQSMAFRGTYKYAAPEQLRGEKVSAQTDVYAVGLMVYEMVAGRGPFDDEPDTRSLIRAQLERVAPPLSAYATVPPALEKLVARALAKDAAQRPQTAMAFAQELFLLKQVMEDRSIASAADTEEMLLTALADKMQRDRAAATLDEPHRFFSGQGGTLEDADPPVKAASGAPDPGPLAFAETDLDRRGATRTAQPDSARSPRHGTEAFSEAPRSPRPFVDLEKFLLDDVAPPARLRLDSTPPPIQHPSTVVSVAGLPRKRRGWLVPAIAGALLATGGVLATTSALRTRPVARDGAGGREMSATASGASIVPTPPATAAAPVSAAVTAAAATSAPVASVSSAKATSSAANAPRTKPPTVRKVTPRPTDAPIPPPMPPPAPTLATPAPAPAPTTDPGAASELKRTVTH